MTTSDPLETRSDDERAVAQFEALRAILSSVRGRIPGLASRIGASDPATLTDRTALAKLPLLRKSELPVLQAEAPPFAGFAPVDAPPALAFLSPGPIAEPGGATPDWWRLGRFLRALGVGAADVVQNCFAYHLTPAGHMMESAVRAVSATCVPAGPGHSEQQVEAAARFGATVYLGTPDFLKVILDKADELDRPLRFAKAGVSGGALYPSLRQEYADRGVTCRQCYATADVGLIAYETEALEGMVVDEGVILEIVRPGTGDPVPDGEVGEVVVTALTPDYPLLRLATGDLSAVLPGRSPCGRTNTRIKGWMGRADQTAKVRGMFVRPEQIAAILARHTEARRGRAIVTRDGEADALTLTVEADRSEGLAEGLAETARAVLKLRAEIKIVAPGALPNDGKVVEDARDYG